MSLEKKYLHTTENFLWHWSSGLHQKPKWWVAEPPPGGVWTHGLLGQKHLWSIQIHLSDLQNLGLHWKVDYLFRKLNTYQHQNIIFLLCTLVFRNFIWKYSPEFWLTLSNHCLHSWSFQSCKVILVLVLFSSRPQSLQTHEQSKLPSSLSSFQKLIHYSYELYHLHKEF